MTNTITFEEFLKKHFGMPKDAHIWKPMLPLEGEPEDYGKKTWEEVYCLTSDYNVEPPAVSKYWEDPFTKECDLPWRKATAVVEDLHALGLIDEDTMTKIIEGFCDRA